MSSSHFIQDTEHQGIDAKPSPRRPKTAAILSCMLVYFDFWFPSYLYEWSIVDYVLLCILNYGLGMTIYRIYISWDFGQENTGGEGGKVKHDLTPTKPRMFVAGVLSCLLLWFEFWFLSSSRECNIGRWIWLVCVNHAGVMGICTVYRLMGQIDDVPVDT